MLKKIGAEWKGLSDAEKKKWEKKAVDDKARYEREMKEYTGGKEAAGTKRPAAKGGAAGSKKAKKDTQEEDNEEEEGGDEEEEDTKE